MNRADKIFAGECTIRQFEDDLYEAGAEFEKSGYDSYDNSVELYDVPPDHRLPEAAQKIIHAAGFSIAYVNHTDGWETHYSVDPAKPFAVKEVWRVSYPRKRDDGTKDIWVEKRPQSWPADWNVTEKPNIKGDEK